MWVVGVDEFGLVGQVGGRDRSPERHFLPVGEFEVSPIEMGGDSGCGAEHMSCFSCSVFVGELQLFVVLSDAKIGI